MSTGIYPRPLNPATPRMLEALRFIATATAERHIAPTVREIADALGTTGTQGVVDVLRALERRWLLTREPMISRSLRVTIAGRIALGLTVKRCPTCGGEARP